jgi:hypothetical protein
MSDDDRERCLSELQQHESQISSLSRTLVELDRNLESATRARADAQCALARHIEFINAQVMRHRISMALIESRLSSKQTTALQPQST